MDTATVLFFAVIAVVLIATGLFVVQRIRKSRDVVEEAGGVTRTSSALGAALRRAWGSGLDDATWDRIEESLIAADLGAETSNEVVNRVKSGRPTDVDQARQELHAALLDEFGDDDRGVRLEGDPAILLVVGVNGTGKTTTIAKLAHHLQREGHKVLLGAADTFRAAAGEQLETWAGRVGVDVVTGEEGGDPAAVAFDSVAAARARGADVVIIDTAGRLHGKKNLMGELQKIHRVAGGDSGVDEILLVLDATAGQNGLTQVREFAEAVPISGIVLTKLDGTAKGGIVITVEKQLSVPVKFVGIGESLDDLEAFEPNSFVRALLEGS